MATRAQLGQLARSRRQETFIGLRARSRGGGAVVGSGKALTARRRAVASRPGTIRQIATGLFKVATGQAKFPLPGFGMAGRALQIQSIGRQQLARVPLPAKIVGTAALGTGAAALTEVLTGRSPARIVHDVGAGVGRSLESRARNVTKQPLRGGQMAHQGALAVQHVAIRQWQTFPGGPVFTRFADGHIEVQKKNGTIKHFRPYRPVVIPRKWNARSMSRVATALKRQRKTATKILQLTGGVPKRTVHVTSKPHRSVDV